MITKDQMVPMILEACPSFTKKFEEFEEDWKGEDEEAPLYILLGDLAEHIVYLHQSNTVKEFPSLFRVIEQFHTEGDPYVREAATIGILEDIQSIALNNGLNPEKLSPYLLSESLIWWHKLNQFWDGDPTALQE